MVQATQEETMHPSVRTALGAIAITVLIAGHAQARITRIQITKTEPAFGGMSFGTVGPYERLTGKAFGEVDPKAPGNALIQDILLAPKNAKGMVEYVTDIDILRPVDRSKANGILFLNITNRGNKGGLSLFNANIPGGAADANNPVNPGDGFLQRRGYTIIWFGWQADVEPGGGRMNMSVPAARNPDGSVITGIVRSELISRTPTDTLSLSSGWFNSGSAPYPAVSTDHRTPLADGSLPTLTVRRRQQDPRVLIPDTEWSFGTCGRNGELPAPSATGICYPAGFKPGYLYELTYRAKDPLVLGLGFAATRDLGTFLRSAQKDDTGTANPVLISNARTIAMGQSQSGRFIRTFINLGFNQGEDGKIVFDGAFPEIGGGHLPLNVRWGQPGRGAGNAEVDNQTPGAEFPFTYEPETDPLSGRTGGILDRCTATRTCPKIIHVATSLEMWELRQSLGFTDPLGMKDLPDPPNVRTYLMVSTQHAPAALPLPTKAPFGACQQQPNPNPHTWTVRALLEALTAWITSGTEPPPSTRPTIAAGNLVAADQVHFPSIPANEYGGVNRPAVNFLALNNPLHVLDFGKEYKPADVSGILSGELPKVGTARYGTLVPQVDEDGNDLGGVRNVFVQVPIGTYTGWNLFNSGYYENGFCTLSGSFIPFASTRQERLAVGDPRRSLEERYPSKGAYVVEVKKAAESLVKQRFLLPQDAATLIKQAEDNGIRQAP
jgi:Alpha/beta hydrolase domain